MTEHCIVNGERCSKCCEVLTIRMDKNFRDWKKWFRRFGDTENDAKIIDFKTVCMMTHQISKRRAKKLNRKLVGIVGGDQSYFKCKNYKNNGCSIYKDRPNMCSGYPYYGKTKDEHLKTGSVALYSDDCTYYIDNII